MTRLIGVVAASLSAVILAPAPAAAPMTRLALVNATVYTNPVDEPMRGANVLIADGRITKVGPGAVVPVPADYGFIDGTGLTVMAGFWNSHVHFFQRKWSNAGAIPAPELARQLQEMLTRYGFTSAFDIGSSLENTLRIRARIESGEVAGPRIRTTGEPLVAPGAVPPDAVIRALGYYVTSNPQITDAAQASAAAATLLGAGADAVKVHLQPPPAPHAPIPDAAIRAAADRAHAGRTTLFVHPATGADVRRAASNGAGIITHTTPMSGPWDPATMTAAREARVALTPTLTLWKHALRHDRMATQDAAVRAAVAQLREWIAAGGMVLFGNDVGAVEYDPSEEYALMREAGMTFRQILTSLTTAPAERFGDAGRLGRVAPGLIADLTVLRGDPAVDPTALTAVQYTLRDGKIVYSAAR